MMTAVIRSATAGDREGWFRLWRLYCDFYKVTLDQTISEKTWQRILSADSQIFGLVAEDDAGDIVGICNYICHSNTWSDQPICYLEDLYVAAHARDTGLGTGFIETLKEIGRAKNWYRIYWITDIANNRARSVYDKTATLTEYVRYEITL